MPKWCNNKRKRYWGGLINDFLETVGTPDVWKKMFISLHHDLKIYTLSSAEKLSTYFLKNTITAFCYV